MDFLTIVISTLLGISMFAIICTVLVWVYFLVKAVKVMLVKWRKAKTRIKPNSITWPHDPDV